jgi:hypothetical protein
MATGVVEAGGEQVLHAQLTHVFERHRPDGLDWDPSVVPSPHDQRDHDERRNYQ